MAESLSHRGPDGTGLKLLSRVGLAHRRLSIVGLDNGAQPLSDDQEAVWVVFNGEIYNYKSLRHELINRGNSFRTETDTEVLVYLWREFGVEMLDRLHGMFAFALWDERTQVLFMARDRLGIKPLYWTMNKNRLAFSSEMKAFIHDPDIELSLDIDSIDRCLRFDYLPFDTTLSAGVRKLLPGHYLIAQADARGDLEIEQARWWKLSFPKIEESSRMQAPHYADSVASLDGLLRQVVADHLVADVPVGVLLSGGLDSTMVLSYAAEISCERLSTFTVGFSAVGVPDERNWASLAAKRFNTDHHEITVTPSEFAGFLPHYVWHMEEPVCEPPAIALHYLSFLASRHVKAVLSGEGADEAFAGYKSYERLLKLESYRKKFGVFASLLSAVARRVPTVFGLHSNAGWIRRLGHDIENHYYSRTSHPYRWYAENDFKILKQLSYPDAVRGRSLSPLRELFRDVEGCSSLSKMLYVDSRTWLPDDLLVKADKMTMANSLELRVPFLDHRVLEFAAQLPDSFKMENGVRKRILRDVARSRVPVEILNRPKAGFPVPYEAWLRSELYDYAKGLLLSPDACGVDVFDGYQIDKLLRRHRSTGRFGKELFMLIVLELWMRIFLAGNWPSAET